MTVFRDLSQHLLDIVENSINAGGSVVHIDIEQDTERDRLSMAVRDNGRGIDPVMLPAITDPWVTTRTTRRVGLGIPFLKQTAEMCDGDFEIDSQPGRGTEICATFRWSHIDLPPLGELVDTLLCMIVGYPEVSFIYHHRVDDRVFEFDTWEIREILGDDVPLSDPDVLGFMRGALREGMEEIGFEASL
jgi:hypothetical protein